MAIPIGTPRNFRGGKTKYWNGKSWSDKKPAKTPVKPNKSQQNKPKPQQQNNQSRHKGGQRASTRDSRVTQGARDNTAAVARTVQNAAKGVLEAPGRLVRDVNRTLEGIQQQRSGVEPSKQNENVRPIGTRNRGGKYWAGQSYGYQSKAQFDKLKAQGAFRGGDIALRRVGSDVTRGVDQRIRQGAGEKLQQAAVKGQQFYDNAPRPVQQALDKTGQALQFVDNRLEDVSRLTNTSRIITDAGVEVATAGAGKAASLAGKGAKAAANRQLLRVGRALNQPRPGTTVRPYRPAPLRIEAPRRSGTVRKPGPRPSRGPKFDYSNNPRVGSLVQGRGTVGAARGAQAAPEVREVGRRLPGAKGTRQTIKFDRVYHGTDPETRRLIEQGGFIPSEGGKYGPGVYTSSNRNTARAYSTGDGDTGIVTTRVPRSRIKNRTRTQQEFVDAKKADAASGRPRGVKSPVKEAKEAYNRGENVRVPDGAVRSRGELNRPGGGQDAKGDYVLLQKGDADKGIQTTPNNRFYPTKDQLKAIRNRQAAASQPPARRTRGTGGARGSRNPANLEANVNTFGGRAAARPQSRLADAVRGPNLRRRDRPQGRTVESLDRRFYTVDTARAPRSQGTPNTINRRGQRRGPAAATAETNAPSNRSGAYAYLNLPDSVNADVIGPRVEEIMAEGVSRADAIDEAVREAILSGRSIAADTSGQVTNRGPSMRNIGRDESPRAAMRSADMQMDSDLRRQIRGQRGENRIRGQRDNTRRQGQRRRVAQRQFDRRAARAQPGIARRQADIAARNRVAGRNTQQRVDRFRAENPTKGEQALTSVGAYRGVRNSGVTVRDGRILERRRNFVSRSNRTGSEVGSRNRGLRRSQPQNFNTPPNPEIRAPRNNAPGRMRDGRRIRSAQLDRALDTVAKKNAEAAAAAKAKKVKGAMAGLKNRQGSNRGNLQVKSNTDLTKRGKGGERLFTPENRAKALKREGDKVKDLKTNTFGPDGEFASPFAGDYDEGLASRAGGKITYAENEGGSFEQGFRSIKNDKSYMSDKEWSEELVRRGLPPLKSKSKVARNLNLANVKNQQGAVLAKIPEGDYITAMPTTKSRALAYKRSSKGALDFLEIDENHFIIRTERIGPTTWRTAKGKIVEWDPKTLGDSLQKLAGKETPRRLQGRRVGGNSRAKLKVRSQRK